jgi:hypothetical protein
MHIKKSKPECDLFHPIWSVIGSHGVVGDDLTYDQALILVSQLTDEHATIATTDASRRFTHKVRPSRYNGDYETPHLVDLAGLNAHLNGLEPDTEHQPRATDQEPR